MKPQEIRMIGWMILGVGVPGLAAENAAPAPARQTYVYKTVGDCDIHADVERFCPVRHVTRAFPPTLLLHGNQDMDVPFEQSVQMAEALRSKGVTCELIALPDHGHAFDSLGDGMKEPPVADAFERVIRFVQERADRPANDYAFQFSLSDYMEGEKGFDVYWVGASVLEELRPDAPERRLPR